MIHPRLRTKKCYKNNSPSAQEAPFLHLLHHHLVKHLKCGMGYPGGDVLPHYECIEKETREFLYTPSLFIDAL